MDERTIDAVKMVSIHVKMIQTWMEGENLSLRELKNFHTMLKLASELMEEIIQLEILYSEK